MKKFLKKYKVQLVFAGYFIILGLFIYGGIFAMVKNIKERAGEIQKKIIDDELDKKNLEKIPQLIEDYEIFSSQKDSLGAILQKESEIEFIKSLEDLARETGNEINLKLIEEDGSQVKATQAKKIKADAKEKSREDIINNLPYKNYITIQLELKGEYSDLMRFVKKLENMKYYANIISFDLKKEEIQTKSAKNNPFSSSDSDNAIVLEENKKKEILKSLINLVVYIR